MALDLSVVGKPTASSTFTYAWKDTVLYALGIGAKKEELDYLYEGRGPKVIPSFAVVPMFKPMFEALAATKADLAMVVHGAQKVLLHSAIPNEAALTSTAKVSGIYDMRKFAVVLMDIETKDASGKLVFENRTQIIVRGAGGFQGEPPPKEEKVAEIPKGVEPAFSVEEKTTPEQALLYRLNGDLNPLHADPEFAEKVGFPQGPILHGLCTFGYMVRQAAKGLGIDAAKITGFEGQFRRPVWPGDTLVTSGWKVAPGKVALQVSVKERNENVMAGCWATYAE